MNRVKGLRLVGMRQLYRTLDQFRPGRQPCLATKEYERWVTLGLHVLRAPVVLYEMMVLRGTIHGKYNDDLQ